MNLLEPQAEAINYYRLGRWAFMFTQRLRFPSATNAQNRVGIPMANAQSLALNGRRRRVSSVLV